MVGIIDYDAGNLKSVEKALERLGAVCVTSREPEALLAADHLILPGVGAFGDAMDKLKRFGLVEPIRDYAVSGRPFLGICLGMQLLFYDSEESPGVEGLSLLPGHILRLPEGEGRKIPHMGWNSLSVRPGASLFKELPADPYVYFVHSYYLKADDPGVVAASAEYGTTVHASVEQGNLFGCQFHPEKSSDTGLAILKNFLEREAL